MCYMHNMKIYFHSGSNIQSSRISRCTLRWCVWIVGRSWNGSIYTNWFSYIYNRWRVKEIFTGNGSLIFNNKLNCFAILSKIPFTTSSILQRACLFENERYEEFGDNYKRSDCVVACRIASIFSLCNCIPFYVPVMQKKVGIFSMESAPKCSLQHSTCLTHYKGIFINRETYHTNAGHIVRNYVTQ